MRIDAHQHFWRYRPETHGWISERMAVLKRDYLPTELEPLARSRGFTGCVAVQASQTLEETRFLLQLAERHPFVRAVVGYVDLLSPDLERQLERFAANKRFRGVRHQAQDEPDERWLVRPDVVRGIGALRRYGLAYDILVYPRQLPAAVELAGRLPDQPFVLDHLGKPEVRSGRMEPWRTQLRQLASHANVSCKLSGLVTEAAWDRWTASDLRPYLELALECFSPRRLMIGSDWPVCLLAGDYGRVVGAVCDFIGTLSVDEQAGILGSNALRVYGVLRAAS